MAYEALLLLFLMLFFFVAGVPIAFVLTAVGLVGILFQRGMPGLYQFALQFWEGGSNFIFICIPLFIFMAVAMEKGKVGKLIFDVAAKWLRRLPGGLGISTIGASAVFAALSGTSVATAATVGLVAYPEMKARGYPKRITLGALSAGGGLGMLIPPSVPLIIYGALTGESIGKLFIAGIIPGIILALLYCLLIAIRAWRGDINVVEPPSTWREKFGSIKKAFWGLALIPVVIGGLYMGFFTPTEAGAVGMVLSLVVVTCIYRSLKIREIVPILGDTLRVSVMIFFLLLGAGLFSYVMALYGIPALVTDWVLHLNMPPIGIILMFNLFFLLLGCFVDGASLMVISLPLAYPVVTALGFDGVWFGIVLMVNINMAVETPPVGLNLYVLKGIARDISLADVTMGVVPFYMCEIVGLILIIFVPWLSLCLLGTMG
ncbi:MAG TPA: C4-dicarboxylate ABC transporter permease [Desulfobacteraceae bacterium]|nr:C4-dicarboxylate ABC transporter permease [Desulfobacteraceae bacterium]